MDENEHWYGVFVDVSNLTSFTIGDKHDSKFGTLRKDIPK